LTYQTEKVILSSNKTILVMNMKKTLALLLCITLLTLGSCGGYKYKPVPIKAPEAYPNHQVVAGAVIAARAYYNAEEAREAFGFDIIGAGLLPVQIIVDHRGPQPLELLPEQALLKDPADNLWHILPAEQAYNRLNEADRLSRVGAKGTAGAALTGAAGAILGFAFGIVTGSDAGKAATKGAVAGAAIGAVSGGAEGYHDPEAKNIISQDLKERSLQRKPFWPNQIAHGFLFFPAEASASRILRIQLLARNSNLVYNLEFKL